MVFQRFDTVQEDGSSNLSHNFADIFHKGLNSISNKVLVDYMVFLHIVEGMDFDIALALDNIEGAFVVEMVGDIDIVEYIPIYYCN